jgi:hypothetical protein
VSVGKLKEIQNGGKRARRGIDQWDQVTTTSSDASSTLTNSDTAKYDHYIVTMTSCIHILNAPQ